MLNKTLELFQCYIILWITSFSFVNQIVAIQIIVLIPLV